MRPPRLLASGLVALGLVLASGSAEAGYIDATMTGVSPAVVLSVQLGDDRPIATYVGPNNWHLIDGTAPFSVAGPNKAFATYCIELTQYIHQGGTYEYFVTPDFATAPQPGIGQGNNSPPGMGEDRARMLLYLADEYFGTLDTAAEHAAFQLAIWEVVFEGPSGLVPAPLNITAGDFKYYSGSSDARDLAQSMLDFVTNAGSSEPGNGLKLYALVNQYKQDQIVITPNTSREEPPNPVPAPAGIVLVLSGAPILLGLRRFRIKSAA